MNPDEGIEAVSRRTAASGTDYATPLVLHASSKRRISLLAFFIQRTSGTQLPLKLVCEEKIGVTWHERSTISFPDEAARKLYRALGARYAVSEQSENGEYIVIPTTKGVVDIASVDGPAVAQAVLRLLSENDIVEHLTTQDLGNELVNAFRGAIRLQELRNAVAELKSYLDDGVVHESTYQDWCNRHSWAFGNAYVASDAIRSITRSDTVDLLMPTVLGGFRDAIELKRPDKQVLLFDSDHRNYYFSGEVSRAIGQCDRYLDMLHRNAEHGLIDARDVIAYHPRATIVIGRSADWDDNKHRGLRGLNARLNGITVMTYDHLLAQGQRMIDVLDGDGDGDGEIVVIPEPPSSEWWADEEPF